MVKIIEKNGITKFDKDDLLKRINFDADMISLTDLWKEAGSPKKKDPNTWFTRESTSELIDSMCDILNTPKMGVLKTKRGKTGGGTWAHKNIALSYAKWLDAKLHILVNEVFFQRVEEEKNPDLIIDRGIATYKRRGKSDEWITKRLKGKLKRRLFTDCLKMHGVEGKGYAECTNNTYNPLSHGNAISIKKQKGLSKTDNLRDSMSEFELSAIEFSETLSAQTIEKENLYGNDQCALACRRSSTIIAKILQEHNKSLF